MNTEKMPKEPERRIRGRIWLDENISDDELIYIRSGFKGKLRFQISTRSLRHTLWMCFDYSRTVELIDLLERGLALSENDGKEQESIGSIVYDITDWLGGPFDNSRGELRIGAKAKSVDLILGGHPMNGFRDFAISLDYRMTTEVLSSLRDSMSNLKDTPSAPEDQFEPRDVLGYLVNIEAYGWEGPDCPPFPPGRITRIVLGEYGAPDFIVEFSEPVAWKKLKKYDNRFLGMKIALVTPRYYGDQLEWLIYGSRRPDLDIAHLFRIEPGVDTREMEIARVGIELEPNPCWVYVRNYKPRRRFWK